MSANLTPWFPGWISPARVGWYEVKCQHGLFEKRIFWDGYAWFLDDRDTRGTASCSFGRSCDQWRGLKGAPAAIGDGL